MSIYFDNSSTTMVCREAAEKACYMMTECFGNPSSLHSMGYAAEKEITAAREQLAQKLGCTAKEIYFTSGGTESNNIGILGGAEAKRRFGNRVVTTAIEHPSVLESMKQLEKSGFEVIYIKPDSKGEISQEAIFEAVNDKTILVSMMAVNNETGLILPLKAVQSAIKRAKAPALFHVDNVQGFGKLPVSLAKLGIDLMSVSGHKVHGPKGVGALYIGSGVRVMPRSFGGGQEKNIRPGTEAVPAICGFGEAVRVMPEESVLLGNITEIHHAILSGLKNTEGITVNSPEKSLPYIINFSCGRVRAETMLHFLESREIFVSTGSACSKAKPSHVLSAMGLTKDRIDSSIRVSLSRYNSISQVQPFLDAVKDGLGTLAYR